MLLDLQVLSSEQGGCATDTPGIPAGELVMPSCRARSRSSAQLRRFLVHRSIRALWRRNRPFTKTFTGARNIKTKCSPSVRRRRTTSFSAHFDHLGAFGAIYPGLTTTAGHERAGDCGSSAQIRWRTPVAFTPLTPRNRTARFRDVRCGDAVHEGSRTSRPTRIGLMKRWGVSWWRGVTDQPNSPQWWKRGAIAGIGSSRLRQAHVFTGLLPDWRTASDHSAFRDAGVSYFYFGVEDHADTHQPTDTSARIDTTFFRGAVRDRVERVASKPTDCADCAK